MSGSKRYAVIFSAKIKQLDQQYSVTAELMRELAFSEYGCVDFHACTEGDQEIAVSYWRSLDDIVAWKQNIKHLAAQKIGKEKWYANYTVEVVEVLRSYQSI